MTSPKFLILVLSVSISISYSTALKCYECMTLPGTTRASASRFQFTQPPIHSSCATEPKDVFIKTCDLTEYGLPANAVPTCASAIVTIGEGSKIYLRGCVPKAVVPQDMEGKCSSRNVQALIDYVNQTLPTPLDPVEYDFSSFNGEFCFCNSDNCNSASGLGENFIFLAFIAVFAALKNVS